MAATLDDVLMKCGGFGRFQVWILFLFALLVLPSTFITYMPMFILTIPKHRCALDNYENDTFAIQSSEHLKMINASIPWDDIDRKISSSCYKYTTKDKTGNDTRTKEQCSNYVYDKTFFRNSFIEQFDLVCESKSIRTHANSIMMGGKIVGGLSQGYLSDRFGRRKAVLILTFMTVVVSFLSAFPFNIASLYVSRLLAGFCTTSIYVVVYVAALEFLCSEYRRLFNVIWAIMWVIGGLILTGVAYFVRDSVHLILIISTPSVLFFSYYWLIPESPRWLQTKGRINEAKMIFENIAKTNKTEFPSEMFEEASARQIKEEKEGKLLSTQEESVKSGKERKDNMIILLRSKKMMLIYVVLLFNWFTNSLTYYALMFNVSNLAGSIYLNFLLLNCVDMVSNITSYLVLDKFGRKWSYAGFMLLATLGCLLCIIPVFFENEDSDQIINGLALAGRAGISTSFSIIYLFSAELFPTSVRNTALGSFSMSSKIGSFFSSYTADLGLMLGGPFKQAIPMIVCGGFAIVALLSSLFLPETKGKSLPNVINDTVRSNQVQDKNRQRIMEPMALVQVGATAV